MRTAIAVFSIALATAFGVAGCASSPETKRTVGETSEDENKRRREAERARTRKR